MAKWILLDADGSTAAQLMMGRGQEPGERDNPDDLPAFKVQRFGRPGERYDADTGRWAMADTEAAADAITAAHVADHGPFSIAVARMQKALEARQMLAGVAIDGIVAAEAAMTGRDPLVLAQIIVDQAVVTEKPELDRIRARRAARNQAVQSA